MSLKRLKFTHAGRLTLFRTALLPRFPLLSLAFLLACSPGEVRQYRVAKEAAPPVKKVSQPADGLKYTTPAGWKVEAASGMRKASLSVPGGGDVSIVSLPGQAGDLKDNVNRWRGQVGLPPEPDLAKIQQDLRKLTVADTPAWQMELYSPAGQPDKAMRVALFEKGGQTWFIKLAGPAALVKAQGPAFELFASSLQLPLSEAPFAAADAGNAAAPPAGMPPANAPNAGSDMAAVPLPKNPTDVKLEYQKPADWSEDPPSGMRVASFKYQQGGKSCDVSVLSLAGDGGGLLSNTNRWRQQLEMAPTDNEGLKNEVKDIVIDGNKGYQMALYSGLEGDGMLVALIEQGEQTWFIKMMGPSALIKTQEANFSAFISSLRFRKANPHGQT